MTVSSLKSDLFNFARAAAGGGWGTVILGPNNTRQLIDVVFKLAQLEQENYVQQKPGLSSVFIFSKFWFQATLAAPAAAP